MLEARETPFIPTKIVVRTLLLVPREKGKRRVERHWIIEYVNVTLQCYGGVNYSVIVKCIHVKINYYFCIMAIVDWNTNITVPSLFSKSVTESKAA